MKRLSVFLLALVVMGFVTPLKTPVLNEISKLEYEGRGVGTQGLDRARDYLLSQLSEIIQEPSEATQDVQVFLGNHLGEKNSVSFTDQFIPLAISRSGQIDNRDMVFVGYGITHKTDEGLIYDDYDGLDVEGKVVVALYGDPAIGAQDSVFKDPALYHYSQSIYKAQNANLHGAKALLLVRGPLSLPQGQEEPDLEFNQRQGGGTVFDLLVGQVKIDSIDKLLDGRSLLDLQAEIAHSQRPQSLPLQKSIDMQVDLKRQVGSVQNIIVKIKGQDEELKNQYIVVGAHYDHLGYGYESSTDPDGKGKIHPGADDNASGTEAVVQLAKWAAQRDLKRSYIFVLFSAEEVGLVGSTHFVEQLPLEEGESVVAMLNLDMVGRMQDNTLYAIGVDTAFEFDGLVKDHAKKMNLTIEKLNSGNGNSDHAPFWDQKIPALFFTTGGHEDYHKPSDTAEKINRMGLYTVIDYSKNILQSLDDLAQAPTYNPASEENRQSSPGRQRGYGVLFGSRPQMPQPDGLEGVLLAGVRPNTPAEKSGLQGGDILVAIGEIEIKSLYDFVFALRFFRPGDQVVVKWLREGNIMQGITTLEQRPGE